MRSPARWSWKAAPSLGNVASEVPGAPAIVWPIDRPSRRRRDPVSPEPGLERARPWGRRGLFRERRRWSERCPWRGASREAWDLVGTQHLAAATDRIADVPKFGPDDARPGVAVGANRTPAQDTGAVLRIEARVAREHVLRREGDVLTDTDVRPDHCVGRPLPSAA